MALADYIYNKPTIETDRIVIRRCHRFKRMDAG